MTLVNRIEAGIHLYDRRTGRQYLVAGCEKSPAIVFLHFKHPQTGYISREPYTIAELEDRFELVDQGAHIFHADSQIVSLIAEAYRIQHAYLFNPLFATETSLIDLLPHQIAAVYGVPATDENAKQSGMIDAPRLRFLLGDDAGAGKTITSGLLIREYLLRRLVKRVLIVPPAGLVGNWERELRVLFRLPFRIISSSEANGNDNPFTDPRNNLAIISIDTLWRDRMRESYLAAQPYDLVVFDEAHKLSAGYLADFTIEKTKRYEMAELIAKQGRHLLLMSATPHMGKDDRYYMLWRLLEPELLSTQTAFQRLNHDQKHLYLLRRMKEEMVNFAGEPLYKSRTSNTVAYPLRQGPGQEQALYDQVTTYCEIHFDRAKQRNRSAAGLALSILQRRLASSTWAMLCSLERRKNKLLAELQAIESGLTDEQNFVNRQENLRVENIRDTKTGDEEESTGGEEESEQADKASEGATDATTVAELKIEVQEVQNLVNLARHVYDQKYESKFEQLWDTLAHYPDTKVLIFTEFRDTLDFLVDRLQGKGLTGKIAQIHGGMEYQERERQADFFRSSARILVATDAAGEGINLQFCWLLVNYDIPWNPARLEQRMGRVHRYKQEHDVVLLNMTSENTREGRVLKVLLDKLDDIRKALGNDKVFDIIGAQFRGKPLADLIFEAVVEGKEAQTTSILQRQLTLENSQQILAEQGRRVEVREVRTLLKALQDKRESAEMRRMMPAYIRRFIQLAAEAIGIEIKGDIEQVFAFDPCPPSITHALNSYPLAIRQRLTVDREQAKPDLTREPKAVYLHPGEPVFEAVTALFLGQHDHEGMRGAIFYDTAVHDPYLFYLARTLIVRKGVQTDDTPETIYEQMTGIQRFADGRCLSAPAHLLLTLDGHDQNLPWPSIPPWALTVSNQTTQVEAFVLESVSIPALETQRQQENNRIPERVNQLRAAYNLRTAELMQQRKVLKEAIAKATPAAHSKLRACEAELSTLDHERRTAEVELRTSIDRLRLGPVTFYAHALVLPLTPEEASARQDLQAEKIALAEVIRRETAEGSLIEDVSNPHLKAGFDLKVLRIDNELRYVEVKGCRGEAAIELTANEWAQSVNHRDRYWLYVVYNCATTPILYRIADPFGRLVAQQTGAVRITTSQIKANAERPTYD